VGNASLEGKYYWETREREKREKGGREEGEKH